ncbi:hypothetical protein EII34_14350 [Arachnia propionica]|uniref:Uncharacterized protein n=1 Tax=Arachnia propionica TaxID=1750 RepID=A0A3P1T1Y6_9ACTN|nr:hypothetical protein [Arachnia propionica]RRD03369.1 hypothetical protein EII34_14350 [Arachnia propionica]
MKPVPWSLLDPGTRLKQIAPCGLLVFTDEAAHHLTVRVVPGSGYVVEDVTRWAALGRLKNLGGDVTLVECVELAAPLRALRNPRFMLLPGVAVPRRTEAWHLVSLLVALAVLGVTVWLRDGWVFTVGFLVALLGVPLVMVAFTPPRVPGQEKLGVTASNIHAYALAVERGELWRGALPAGAPVRPGTQVERIRQEYAELRSDLLYRLENPALFDPAVPTTAAFETALVEFVDSPTSQAADVVEIRFQVARQHAERTGLRHVAPAQRGEVARAVKIARLAQDASSPGERVAALTQLQRVLESLALYYLPSRADLPEITK